MNKKIIIGIGVAVGLALILVIMLNTGTLPDNEILNEDESTEVEKLVDRLPYEFSVGNRTITFEEGVEPLEVKEEFAENSEPIEVPEENDPLMFVEQAAGFFLAQEGVQDQSEFYSVNASFYSEEEDRISALINISDLPDDSIGEVEERIDFALTEGNWEIEWSGRRMFCRRADAEFWQPADQPCP